MVWLLKKPILANSCLIMILLFCCTAIIYTELPTWCQTWREIGADPTLMASMINAKLCVKMAVCNFLPHVQLKNEHNVTLTVEKKSEINDEHILTFHKCRCRRCGAFHLLCSSSAGTGYRKIKIFMKQQTLKRASWETLTFTTPWICGFYFKNPFFISSIDNHIKQLHLTPHHQNDDEK